MNRTVTILLKPPASDMIREEILKQVPHLSSSLQRARMPEDGSKLEFEVPESQVEKITGEAEHLCKQIQRSLRQVERKIVYRSPAVAHPNLRGANGSSAGIHMAGQGQVMLEGLALELFRYFDHTLGSLEKEWAAQPLITPTLIPASVLSKCDYFGSFPNMLTFACHLQPEAAVINRFRDRYKARNSLDAEALNDMAQPQTCLSPAVCYHVYHRNQGVRLPEEGLIYSVRGKCFRYEGSNLRDMRRLWDFTMRELVFLGTAERVLEQRQRCVEMVAKLLEDLKLAAEIRTASDPFYIAVDAPLAQTYFQLTADTKYEISMLLPEDKRLAVGSLNYHTDFFGRAFEITLEGGEHAHAACVGFGLERLVHAFLAQHGSEPNEWDSDLRNAIFTPMTEARPAAFV